MNFESFYAIIFVTIFYQILVAAIGIFIVITILVIIKLVYEAHIVAMMEGKNDNIISQSKNNKSKNKSKVLTFRGRKGSNSIKMRQRNRRRSQIRSSGSVIIV